ncbi:MAG: hypothetical protein JWP02_2105, partial [Acidimicrobiales bacterium]|nr:hypothetical protein [Acidimicrobiales bacterium]
MFVGGNDEPWTSQLFWRGWAGFYEPETLQLFYGLACRSRVTLDVGANVGVFTLVAAHANPAGTVVAFEPSSAVDRLDVNVAANKLTNVTVVRAAAGAAGGEAELFSGVASDPEQRVTVMASSSLRREHV